MHLTNSFVNEIFWNEDFQKTLKNMTSLLFSEPVYGYEYYHKQQKGPGTSCQSLIRLRVLLRSFLSLITHHLVNFDASVIQQIAIENLCKLFHDVVILPPSISW